MNRIESEKQIEKFYYFYSISCITCQQTMPIIDTLIDEGYPIIKLDHSKKQHQSLLLALEIKFGINSLQMPTLINRNNGNYLESYNNKERIKKMIEGEMLEPLSFPLNPPSLDASDNEILNWKKEYTKWLSKNSHLKGLMTVEEFLNKPRPKTEGPPIPTSKMTNKELDNWIGKWGNIYEKWRLENIHIKTLPILSEIANSIQKIKESKIESPKLDANTIAVVNRTIIKLEQEIEETINRAATSDELKAIENTEKMLIKEKHLPSNTKMARHLAIDHWRSLKAFVKGSQVIASQEDAQKRWQICNACDFLLFDETNPETSKKDGRCTQCGCFMNIKVHYAVSKCPKGKWNEIN